jgi:hypothetical protein
MPSVQLTCDECQQAVASTASEEVLKLKMSLDDLWDRLTVLGLRHVESLGWQVEGRLLCPTCRQRG